MAATGKLTASAELAAFRSVRRICYAGLDSVALRVEVARRVSSIIPGEAYSFCTNDPDTGLLTHAVSEGLPINVGLTYIEHIYPFERAAQIIDQARGEEIVMQNISSIFHEVLRGEGLGYELHTVLRAGGGLWGSACLLREEGSHAFSEREMGFMRKIAPHFARGLKTAALLGTTGAQEEPTRDASLAPPVADGVLPGVVVMDARGRLSLRNTAAGGHLQDIGDVGAGADAVPTALGSVVLKLRAVHAAAAARQESDPLGAEIRVRGRSGRWYTLRASLAEPDASGESSTVVVIEPAGPREIAPILTRLYGLSPREREVLAMAARGASTKRIATLLGISVYTVQDHLDRASEKVGVRGRRALLAKLFFDAYAPALVG